MTQQKSVDPASIVTSNPLVVEGGQALAEGVEALLTASTEYQSELIDFVAMRLEKDRAVAEEIVNCKSVTDAMRLQAAWAGETIQDYNEEMVKMLSMFGNRGTAGAPAKHKRA